MYIYQRVCIYIYIINVHKHYVNKTFIFDELFDSTNINDKIHYKAFFPQMLNFMGIKLHSHRLRHAVIHRLVVGIQERLKMTYRSGRDGLC